MTILSKATYKFNAIPIKLSMTFITEVEWKKFNMETQMAQLAKTILIKKNVAGAIKLPDFNSTKLQ